MKNRRLSLALWGLTYSLPMAAFAANTPPTIVPSLVEVTEDVTEDIYLQVADIDNDPLTYKIVTKPKKGTATLKAANSNKVTYIPQANVSGSDSFVFSVTDGKSKVLKSTVVISINAVNDPPVASSQTVSAFNEDTSKKITLKATDIDSRTLTYVVVNPPAHGTYTQQGAVITYTPNANFFGSDSFTFKANDTLADSALATVALTVKSVNDAPEPIEQNITVNPGQTTPIILKGKDVDLTNTEADSDKLIYLLASGRPNTTGTIDKPLPTGFGKTAGVRTVQYTPKAEATSDVIWFKVKDTAGKVSVTKKVTITVDPNNQPFVFDDANLLRCFSSAPSEATLKALTTFTCDGVDLSTANLSQLANLPNLRVLKLTNTKLTTITDLAGLTQLTSLNLGFNSISSISPLAGMTQLQSLNLGFNSVSDITALTNLNALQELYLDANKITSIGSGATSPLAGKSSLAKLALDDNQITDISALSTLSGLTHVGLGYNKISDVTALAGKSLQVLVLDANYLTSLSTLPKPNTLQELYLRGNGPTDSNVLTSVIPLENALADLRVLELGFNNIDDASPLRTLTNLTRLGLEANNFANVNTLSGLTKLITFDLEHNQLVSTDGIARLASADGLLRLDDNRLLDDDLTALAVRGNSYNLRIEDNCLSSFPFSKVYGEAWQFPAARCGGTAPVAMGDDVNIPQNTATNIPLVATDPNGDTVTYKLEEIAVSGGILNTSVGSEVNGAVVFTPNASHLKNAGYFKFSAKDSNGETSQVVTVNLWVVPSPLVSCYGTVDAVPQSVDELNDGVCTGKNLSDISWLPNYFPGLTKLYIGGNPNITDYSPLTSLTSLKALSLAGNNLNAAALDVVKSLGSVDILELNQCQLDNADIAKLSGMTWLSYLALDDNDITDISSLSTLTRLGVLHLSDNPTKTGNNAITDITAIQTPGMPYLQNITLNGNKIGDSAKQAGNLAALASRSALNYLELDDNSLTSINGLATIPNLDTLALRKNQLSPTALDAFKNYPNSLALYVEQNCLNSADLKTGWVSYVTRDTSGNQCSLVNGACPPYFDATRSCAALP